VSARNKSQETRPIEAWAIVQVSLQASASNTELQGASADRLEILGALLADDSRVGGVETRDHATSCEAAGFAVVEQPQLVVYTTPEHIAAIQEAATLGAQKLELHVRVDGEVRTDDDWRDRWKQFYSAQTFDNTIVVRPSWIAKSPGSPALELILDPGRAFGTGLHQSTRLCQEMVVKLYSQTFDPASVLDLGCGSGILGLMAARLFPRSHGDIYLIDIDPEAADTAQENTEANGLSSAIHCMTGVADTIGPRQFDLVFANIRPNVLVPEAAAIARAVAPGGRLMLSGILTEEAPEVERAYHALGMMTLATTQNEGWSLLLLTSDLPT